MPGFLALAAGALLSLAGSEWGPPEGGRQNLQFAQDRASGHAGCNRFSGTYAQTGASLRFGSIATTRMACPGPAMAAERNWLAMLERTRTFEATRLRLILKDAGGAVITTLERRDVD